MMRGMEGGVSAVMANSMGAQAAANSGPPAPVAGAGVALQGMAPVTSEAATTANAVAAGGHGNAMVATTQAGAPARGCGL